MTKHTPGPWKAIFNEENKRTKIGSWFLYCDGFHNVPFHRVTANNERAKANAHLIEAAPGMLAALQLAESRYQRMGLVGSDYEQIRAAIAKATGGEP